MARNKLVFGNRYQRLLATYILWFGVVFASLLIDLDHIGLLLAKGIEVRPITILRESGRPMHYVFFLLSLVNLFFAYTSAIRLRIDLGKVEKEPGPRAMLLVAITWGMAAFVIFYKFCEIVFL